MPRLLFATLATLTLLVPAAHAQEPVQPVAPPAPAPPPASASAGSFQLFLDPALQSSPYTGRVYVALAKGGGEPRQQMGNWFGGSQVIALDVKDIAPGAPIIVGADALSFPKPFAEIPQGEYTVQAIARRNLDVPNAGMGDGDLYSKPIKVTFNAAERTVAKLKLTDEVKTPAFKETDRVKLVEIDSPLLTAFAGRPMKARAGVILPKAWKDDATQHYPTLYFIGGFGGDHRAALSMQRVFDDPSLDNLLVVVPDPTCFLGHSVFADSANNGPRGQSLMKELIPAVESKYHGSQSGSNRYVTGISSGGWSCLWLQVTYSDDFAGCWSHCPDPVDFRDFQRIDLYAADANMYRDKDGKRRPLARAGGGQPDENGVQPEDRVMLWYDDFVRQETVMGPGGQIHSFEAVFSPKGPDGKPAPLFDRTTGKIDPAAAKAWEPYDIRLVIERNWPTLGPKLKGKLHIYAGGKDTFYLEGAAKLLKESLTKLDSDAEVVIVPGMPHTIHQPGLQAMFKTIADREHTN